MLGIGTSVYGGLNVYMNRINFNDHVYIPGDR